MTISATILCIHGSIAFLKSKYKSMCEKKLMENCEQSFTLIFINICVKFVEKKLFASVLRFFKPMYLC